jgi:hypothetical protein
MIYTFNKMDDQCHRKIFYGDAGRGSSRWGVPSSNRDGKISAVFFEVLPHLSQVGRRGE